MGQEPRGGAFLHGRNFKSEAEAAQREPCIGPGWPRFLEGYQLKKYTSSKHACKKGGYAKGWPGCAPH